MCDVASSCEHEKLPKGGIFPWIDLQHLWSFWIWDARSRVKASRGRFDVMKSLEKLRSPKSLNQYCCVSLHVFLIFFIFSVLHGSKAWSWKKEIYLRHRQKHSEARHFSFMEEDGGNMFDWFVFNCWKTLKTCKNVLVVTMVSIDQQSVVKIVTFCATADGGVPDVVWVKSMALSRYRLVTGFVELGPEFDYFQRRW